MNTISLIFLAFLTVSLMNSSQASDIENKKKLSLKEFCELDTSDCRKNVHVMLNLENGSVYDNRFEFQPQVVQSGHISVMPGEKIYLEAEKIEIGLTNFKEVKKITNPNNTITISFSQEKIGDSWSMIMNINNPFNQTVKYDAYIMRLNSNSLEYTSSCPIISGISSTEMWPYPIFTIALKNFRFIQKSEKMVCK